MGGQGSCHDKSRLGSSNTPRDGWSPIKTLPLIIPGKTAWPCQAITGPGELAPGPVDRPGRPWRVAGSRRRYSDRPLPGGASARVSDRGRHLGVLSRPCCPGKASRSLVGGHRLQIIPLGLEPGSGWRPMIQIRPEKRPFPGWPRRAGSRRRSRPPSCGKVGFRRRSRSRLAQATLAVFRSTRSGIRLQLAAGRRRTGSSPPGRPSPPPRPARAGTGRSETRPDWLPDSAGLRQSTTSLLGQEKGMEAGAGSSLLQQFLDQIRLAAHGPGSQAEGEQIDDRPPGAGLSRRPVTGGTGPDPGPSTGSAAMGIKLNRSRQAAMSRATAGWVLIGIVVVVEQQGDAWAGPVKDMFGCGVFGRTNRKPDHWPGWNRWIKSSLSPRRPGLGPVLYQAQVFPGQEIGAGSVRFPGFIGKEPVLDQPEGNCACPATGPGGGAGPTFRPGPSWSPFCSMSGRPSCSLGHPADRFQGEAAQFGQKAEAGQGRVEYRRSGRGSRSRRSWTKRRQNSWGAPIKSSKIDLDALVELVGNPRASDPR